MRLHRLAAAARQSLQLRAALWIATAITPEEKADEEPHVGHASDVGLRGTISTWRQVEPAAFVPILPGRFPKTTMLGSQRDQGSWLEP